MSRIKKAEQALIDSKKSFPIDECRAKIARRYGLSAVALSGPCQGSNLAECVCQQLNDRWEEIGKRFAYDESKTVKLALKVAETLSVADDSERCEEFLQEKMKFEKKASSEITSYLRSYAMDDLMNKDIDQMADEVETEDEVSDLIDQPEEPVGEEPFGEEPDGEEPVTEEPVGEEPLAEETVDFELSEPEVPAEPEATEVVSIDVPVEVAKQVLDDIKMQLEGPENLGLEEGGIPGEPEELQKGEEKQIVVSDEDACVGCGTSMAGDKPENAEELREKVEGPEHEEKESPEWEKLEHKLGLEEEDEGEEGHEYVTDEGEDKAEKDAAPVGTAPSVEVDVAPEVKPQSKPKRYQLYPTECKQCGDKIRVTDPIQAQEKSALCTDCARDLGLIDAGEGSDVRGPLSEEDDPYQQIINEEESWKGQFAKNKKATKTAQSDEQVVGHELIPNKEKQVEAPKPISEGNLDQEGYSANGKKFQDGQTMKNEQKFDPKTVDKSEVSGGSASLMGKDESYPEGTPEVPAGSAPIKNEELTGGDVATKGTVIATIKPEGILVTSPDGKKYLAKASIRRTTKEAAQALSEAIKNVAFDGDAKKFAADALRACKKASKAVNVNLNTNEGIKISSPFGTAVVAGKISNVTENLIKEMSGIPFDGDLKKYAEAVLDMLKQSKSVSEEGCVKIDTGKLEAEKFTNDGEKKPDEGGVTTKGDGKKPDSEKGQVETDTGELEAKEFTNDEEKKAEASAKKSVKKAADKKVEEPEPISEGNLETDGFTAGGDKFQDGKTMGNEEKFNPEEVKESDVSAGDKSLMGDEQPAAKEGPEVPATNETDLATKGTVIADNKGIAQEVREARLKAASAYVADLLRHGEIAENEYTETLEKYAQMPVQSIIALATSTRKTRERVMKQASSANVEQPSQKTAGIVFPLIVNSSNNEKSLKDRLVEQFKLTKDLNKLDSMR